MSLFHSILSGFQKKITHTTSNLEDIASVLSECIGSTISSNQLQTRGTKLFIKASPTVKLAIKLHQEIILSRLKVFTITTIG